ncbi:MAG: adenine deaminase [Saprospiraceae bacterium]|nr:adenine deaminase [Saprospiraceae bacterium]
MEKLKGNLIDILQKKIFPAEIVITDGIITQISEIDETCEHYILPGFIDAHVHIESSMLVPYEFARKAMEHGTVATVSDPHEIANVCGMDGIMYMIENAADAGMSFFFGAPSCVPATSFETAGAVINKDDIEILLAREDILYLSEMMNYPGVLAEDPDIMAKLEFAKKNKKPIDGHAPGLRGAQAAKYISFGISTDHECTEIEEAREKLAYGMKILIREGSAAKNYEALEPLIGEFPEMVMFCSDDKHPDDLMTGHINELVRKSCKKYDMYDVLRIACINPILHYKLPIGYLRAGDRADFIKVADLESWKLLETYVRGQKYVRDGKCILPDKTHKVINHFGISEVSESDFTFADQSAIPWVIKAINGSLITEKVRPENVPSDEVLHICVINRYKKSPVFTGLITGFGKMKGAVASSVAHDSHNIVVVGLDKEDIVAAANLIIKNSGGLSFVHGGIMSSLPLPVAGLMHTLPAEEVALQYQTIDKIVKEQGCTLSAPFMTLSFMALLVIPKIKMSDLGLFDAENFSFL